MTDKNTFLYAAINYFSHFLFKGFLFRTFIVFWRYRYYRWDKWLFLISQPDYSATICFPFPQVSVVIEVSRQAAPTWADRLRITYGKPRTTNIRVRIKKINLSEIYKIILFLISEHHLRGPCQAVQGSRQGHGPHHAGISKQS